MFVVENVSVGVEVFAKGDCFDLITLAPDRMVVVASLISLHSPFGEVLGEAMLIDEEINPMSIDVIPSPEKNSAFVRLNIDTTEGFLPLREMTEDDDLHEVTQEMAAIFCNDNIRRDSFVSRRLNSKQYFGLLLRQHCAAAFLGATVSLMSSFEVIYKTGFVKSKKDTLTISLTDGDGHELNSHGIKDVKSLLVEPDVGYASQFALKKSSYVEIHKKEG